VDFNPKGDPIIKSFGRMRLYVLSGTAALAIGLMAFSGSNAYAATPGLTEQWVTIATYPSLHTCDDNGQVYINEGLASQYRCPKKGSSYTLQVLTLDG